VRPAVGGLKDEAALRALLIGVRIDRVGQCGRIGSVLGDDAGLFLSICSTKEREMERYSTSPSKGRAVTSRMLSRSRGRFSGRGGGSATLLSWRSM
jgi:hypothetical protein